MEATPHTAARRIVANTTGRDRTLWRFCMQIFAMNQLLVTARLYISNVQLHRIVPSVASKITLDSMPPSRPKALTGTSFTVFIPASWFENFEFNDSEFCS